MHDRDIQWLYDRVQLQTKVIISRFHTSPEFEANKLGYRVVSWNGRKVEEDQIGILTLVDRVNIYWQEPNGQLTKVKQYYQTKGMQCMPKGKMEHII